VKNVLVISYYFPPLGMGSVLRPVKFVKYFPHFNWHPIVLTSTPKTYYARDEYLLGEVREAGGEVYRTKGRKHNLLTAHKLKTLPNEGKRMFFSKLKKVNKFPDPQVKWRKKALKLGAEIIEKEKIDIIYATAPPFTDLMVAAELKKKYGMPLVVDYRDSWIHSPDNFYPTNMHRFINMKKEQEVLRAADETITINRRIKEYLIENYPGIKHTDINLIPHGFDQEDFDTASSQLPRTNKMRFTHAGSFYNLSSPKYFFEGLALAFKKRPGMSRKVEACFIGLLSKEDHKLILKNNLIESVYAPGYVNHKETIKYLLASDVLWFTIGKGRGDELISTVKLSEYFGARKPILACIPEGVAKGSLRFHDAVKICEPDDPQAIADLLIEYFDLYEKNLLPVPNEEVIEKYNVEKLTHELVRYFEFLIDISHDTKFVPKSLKFSEQKSGRA
jgi:hypothetical protein